MTAALSQGMFAEEDGMVQGNAFTKIFRRDEKGNVVGAAIISMEGGKVKRQTPIGLVMVALIFGTMFGFALGAAVMYSMCMKGVPL